MGKTIVKFSKKTVPLENWQLKSVESQLFFFKPVFISHLIGLLLLLCCAVSLLYFTAQFPVVAGGVGTGAPPLIT